MSDPVLDFLNSQQGAPSVNDAVLDFLNAGAPQPKEQKQLEESTASQIAGFLPHQAALIANNVVKGATALPEMIANIPAATANTVRGAGDWALGIDQYSPSAQYVNPFGEGADALTPPSTPFSSQPQNAAERMEGDVIRPLAGVTSGVAAGRDFLANSSKFIGPKLASFMASNPALQAQAAVGGGVLGGTAREAGASSGLQSAASLAGGILTPSAVNIAKGIKGFIDPFTKGGQAGIVNNAIASYAEDPQKALATLQASKEYIPGFNATAGTSSGDTGLIGLERTLAQQPQSPFTGRYLQQNATATEYLNKLAGSPADVAAAEQARKAATNPLYKAAETGKITSDAAKPVIDNIDNQIAKVGAGSDAGKTLIALKAKIQGSLPQEKSIATGLLDADGKPIVRTETSEPPFSNTVQIFREERDNLLKRGDQPNAYGSTVRSAISPANAKLGAVLESENPSFGKAQQTFADMSKPINQMETMQEIVKKVTNGTQDASGNYFLSPAKIGSLMKQGQVNTDYNGWQSLEDALSPAQHAGLKNTHAEIARANLPNTAVAMKAGSNTYHNLASTNAMSKVTGGRLPFAIKGIDKWLYSNANEKIKEQLAQALLDKQRTIQGLMKGTPASNEPIMPSIARGLAKAMAATITYGQTP